MIGNAVVYTTGKNGESRSVALYAYINSGRQIENVQYDAPNDWTEILTENANGGIRIIYQQNLDQTQW